MWGRVWGRIYLCFKNRIDIKGLFFRFESSPATIRRSRVSLTVARWISVDPVRELWRLVIAYREARRSIIALLYIGRPESFAAAEPQCAAEFGKTAPVIPDWWLHLSIPSRNRRNVAQFSTAASFEVIGPKQERRYPGQQTHGKAGDFANVKFSYKNPLTESLVAPRWPSPTRR